MAEDTPQTLAPVAASLAASLTTTTIVVCLLCRPPRRPSLTWMSLSVSALSFVLIAAVVHASTVWLIYRILKGKSASRLFSVVSGGWTSVAWLPLLTLLVAESSVWIAAVLPLMAISAALFLKRWKIGPGPDATLLDVAYKSYLFTARETLPLWLTVLPALVVSIAFQVGVAAVVAGHSLIAGLCFAACLVLPVWEFPSRWRIDEVSRINQTRNSARFGIATSLLATLLTGIVLLPFLKHGLFTGGFNSMLQPSRVHASSISPKPETKSKDPWDYYSGVILVLPPKQHEEIVPPAHLIKTRFSTASARPVIIPFDGAYWYFKRPDQRPKPDARTVRGDPTKANIHSTDHLPLAMEAHQHLGTSIHTDCCSAIRLAIRNADDRVGAIYVELLLRDTGSKSLTAQSLGTLVIHSSEQQHISLSRPPVDEVLTFLIPRAVGSRQFNEITVALKPAKERSRAGAHVAVQHFELVP